MTPEKINATETSSVNHREYLTRGEEYRILAKVGLPYITLFWLYFQIDHLVPMLIDILILPLTLVVAIVAFRRFERGRLWDQPGESRYKNPWTIRTRVLMCWIGAPFYWVLWINKRHGDSIPETILIPVLAISLLGLFASAVLAIIHTAMIVIERRNKRSVQGNIS